MKLKKLLTLLSVCIILISCAASKKGATISTIDLVNSHILNKDGVSLIADMGSYPEYKQIIEETLYNGIDYSTYSYRSLKHMSAASVNDLKASIFFDSLLICRQAEAIDMLSGLSIQQVGDFYRKHHAEHDYLKDVLTETYLSALDTIDYRSLKTLYKSFLGTNLESAIAPSYKEARESAMRDIRSLLTEYYQQEQSLLDMVEYNTRQEIQEHIETQIVDIVSLLSEKLDRGIFKKIFKRQDMDNYSFLNYSTKLIGERLNQQEINQKIETNVRDFISASNKMRGQYISNYLDEAYSDPAFYISPNVLKQDSIAMQISTTDAAAIQDIRNTGTAVSIASVALAFTPYGWVAIAADIADLYLGFTESSRVEPMLDSLSSSIYTGTTEAVNEHLNTLFARIKRERNDSESYFWRKLNEDF